MWVSGSPHYLQEPLCAEVSPWRVPDAVSFPPTAGCTCGLSALLDSGGGGEGGGGERRLPFLAVHQPGLRQGGLIVAPYSWSHLCPLSQAGPEEGLADQLQGSEQTKMSVGICIPVKGTRAPVWARTPGLPQRLSENLPGPQTFLLHSLQGCTSPPWASLSSRRPGGPLIQP